MCRLFDKHKQFEQSQQDVARLQEHIDHLNRTLDDLQQVIKDKDAEIITSVLLLLLHLFHLLLLGVVTITILILLHAVCVFPKPPAVRPSLR